MTDIEIGTFCTLSARLVAVTMISFTSVLLSDAAASGAGVAGGGAAAASLAKTGADAIARTARATPLEMPMRDIRISSSPYCLPLFECFLHSISYGVNGVD